jgi:hypothetical protein
LKKIILFYAVKADSSKKPCKEILSDPKKKTLTLNACQNKRFLGFSKGMVTQQSDFKCQISDFKG